MGMKEHFQKAVRALRPMLDESAVLYRQNTETYKKNWKDFRALFVISGAITVTVLLTVIQLLAQLLLQKAGIPCLTFSTVADVFHNPSLCIGLFLLCFLILYAAWFQYTVILTGIRDILNDRYSLLSTFFGALKKTVRTSPLTILLFAFYLLLFLPMAGIMYPTDLFNRYEVPQFILSYMSSHLSSYVILLLCLMLFLWLTLKFYYVLPLCILKDVPFTKSFSVSSEMMQGKKLRTLLHILFLLLLFLIVECLFFLPLSGIQWIFDRFFPDGSFYCCILIIASIKLFAAFYLIRIAILLFLSTFPRSFFSHPGGEESNAQRVERKKGNRIISVLSHIFSLIMALATAIVFMLDFQSTNPLVISYQGLDGSNGFPNTVETMTDTVRKAYPDYITIDVQETKDGKFVVVNADDLFYRFHEKRPVSELTLEEVTSLRSDPSDYQAGICTLDEYMKEAGKLGQKLILSLYCVNSDAERMTLNFLEQFGNRILKEGHLLESKNYDVVCTIIAENEKAEAGKTASSLKYPVYFVVAVPLLYPNIEADGLDVEVTNLQQAFVNSASSHDQKLICWLADDTATMKTMILMNVDGIVTRKPSLLRTAIRDIKESDYQAIVWKYILMSL